MDISTEIDYELLALEELNLKMSVDSFSESDLPIYDEYYGGDVHQSLRGIEWIGQKGAKKSPLRDPKGGLTAAGRAHFKRKEGANLKPGVKGPADTPEKMRRKGSFLTRFFTNPSGPMKDDNGKPTRLALSAAAWGERVPQSADDAAKLAAKGRRLLERYEKSKKKDSNSFEMGTKQLGSTIGQQSGRIGGSGSSGDEIDRDGDGVVLDGTPDERPAENRDNGKKPGGYEKRRRKFVRSELDRQGIQRNARLEDRSQRERNARKKARDKFDSMNRPKRSDDSKKPPIEDDADRNRRQRRPQAQLEDDADRNKRQRRQPRPEDDADRNRSQRRRAEDDADRNRRQRRPQSQMEDDSDRNRRQRRQESMQEDADRNRSQRRQPRPEDDADRNRSQRRRSEDDADRSRRQRMPQSQGRSSGRGGRGGSFREAPQNNARPANPDKFYVAPPQRQGRTPSRFFESAPGSRSGSRSPMNRSKSDSVDGGSNKSIQGDESKSAKKKPPRTQSRNSEKK
jgi:hypothetical protein